MWQRAARSALSDWRWNESIASITRLWPNADSIATAANSSSICPRRASDDPLALCFRLRNVRGQPVGSACERVPVRACDRSSRGAVKEVVCLGRSGTDGTVGNAPGGEYSQGVHGVLTGELGPLKADREADAVDTRRCVSVCV